MSVIKIDPKLDLVLERDVDVPVELVWTAWTTPRHLKEWFVPKPWTISRCEIDLRSGGAFNTTMRSPEGEEFPSGGCFLEIVLHQRLVFTDTLLPGFRPAEKPFFTAALLLEPMGERTKYTAIAIHGSEESRKNHEEMGFHDGWGTVANQIGRLHQGRQSLELSAAAAAMAAAPRPAPTPTRSCRGACSCNRRPRG